MLESNKNALMTSMLSVMINWTQMGKRMTLKINMGGISLVVYKIGLAKWNGWQLHIIYPITSITSLKYNTKMLYMLDLIISYSISEIIQKAKLTRVG